MSPCILPSRLFPRLWSPSTSLPIEHDEPQGKEEFDGRALGRKSKGWVGSDSDDRILGLREREICEGIWSKGSDQLEGSSVCAA
mmetsp:Transcript_15344/g.31126  ORF Transcript_15344/g.31126 Transcript_15344/m.31126 type:complete len:84 (+) Transcript_15344:259-510(+)